MIYKDINATANKICPHCELPWFSQLKDKSFLYEFFFSKLLQYIPTVEWPALWRITMRHNAGHSNQQACIPKSITIFVLTQQKRPS